MLEAWRSRRLGRRRRSPARSDATSRVRVAAARSTRSATATEGLGLISSGLRSTAETLDVLYVAEEQHTIHSTWNGRRPERRTSEDGRSRHEALDARRDRGAAL